MNSFTENQDKNKELAPDTVKKSGHRDAETQETQETQIHRNSDTQVTHETFGNVLTDLLPDIKELVPLEDHETMGCMFPLARIARTIERRTGCPVTVDRLEMIFDAWYAYCESADISTHTGDPSDYFASFVAIYDSTRVPHDEGIMERALEAAMRSPEPLGINKLRKTNPDILRISSLCYQLHLLNVDGHFFLSVRKVEQLIPHLKRQKINYIIRYLCASGFIEEIQKGSLSGRQASVFKYMGDKASKEELGRFFRELKESLVDEDPNSEQLPIK